jgi:hypothetical protein
MLYYRLGASVLDKRFSVQGLGNYVCVCGSLQRGVEVAG